jgi:pyruvate dehydrogenase E1 component alpha subunit
MVAALASETTDARRALAADGTPLPGARLPAIAESTLTRMFEVMTLTRVVDDRMARLHHAGRLGSCLAALGEEAIQLAVAPLRPTDWLFPSHREPAAWFWRGYTVQQFVDQLLGNAGDPSRGRQLPAHHSARWLNVVSISSPAGTQIPQAVGAAYAARMLGKDDVTMVSFGASAAATGEFHVGVNFAAVWRAPCVFVCRNPGGVATSPPGRLASKARGYGVPTIRVDGSDAVAVWQAASEAVDRARSGAGPTLIEAVAAPRSTPDDRAAPGPGGPGDPLARLRGYLQHRGLWTERWEAELAERCQQQVADALVAAEAKPAPAIESMFDDVYEQPTWNLREQRAELVAQPRVQPPTDRG